MGEDLPFGTHGGLAVHHMFPLDGEYVFTIEAEAQRHGQHHRRHRGGRAPDRDRVSITRSSSDSAIGGKFKGPDPAC